MIKLIIVTPERSVVGPITVKSVSLPGEKGEMTILPGHARLVSVLITGILTFERENGTKETAAISSGFAEVSNDQVTVLADTLELAQEIDVERAKKAQKLAEDKLSAKEHFEEDMQKWQRKYERSMIRQQAAGALSIH